MNPCGLYGMYAHTSVSTLSNLLYKFDLCVLHRCIDRYFKAHEHITMGAQSNWGSNGM